MCYSYYNLDADCLSTVPWVALTGEWWSCGRRILAGGPSGHRGHITEGDNTHHLFGLCSEQLTPPQAPHNYHRMPPETMGPPQHGLEHCKP